MIKLFLGLLVLSTSALAYVPSVESLYRHGQNPDVTANGVSVALVIKKMDAGAKTTNNDAGLVAEAKAEDYYKLFFTKFNNESMKVAQTRYSNGTFSEASLMEKVYYPNFTSYTIKGSPEESEKGLFHAMLRSMIFNDGAFLVNYLKSLGIPVKLNSEILNRQKVEYLADYKKYLVSISRDRNAKKSESNPLKPEDPAAREKVDHVMNEPMYVDHKQVKL